MSIFSKGTAVFRTSAIRGKSMTLPEEIESIQNMPVHRNAKDVKQFLELFGYYQKFIP